MTEDSDLPAGLRILTEEEAAALPPTEDPGEPTEENKERWRKQVEDEYEDHPAFRAVVPED